MAKAQYIDTCTVGNSRVYTVEGGQANSDYEWTINDEAQSATGVNVSYQWNEAGVFNIAVKETTEFGCIGEIYAYMVLISDSIEDYEIHIPNVFTPDGNQQNDDFTVKGRNLDNYHIKIYNRWGKTLYKSDDILLAWDGKHNGVICSSGIYFYTIVYSKNNKTKTENGFLHLFK